MTAWIAQVVVLMLEIVVKWMDRGRALARQSHAKARRYHRAARRTR